MAAGSGSRVAGVDGCRGGWVVVTDGPDGATARVEATAAPLVAELAAGELVAVAIDMPMGLPAVGPRPCDVLARALLGPRRASVFPAPVRAALGAADHAQACARSRAASGRGLSIQAFGLLPRIAELDRVVPVDLADRFVEAHPELAFLRLAGGVPLAAKRSDEGRRRRLELAAAVLGVDPGELARRAGAPLLDVLDAAALVATARRLAAGTAELLGGEADPTGRPMQIAW